MWKNNMKVRHTCCLKAILSLAVFFVKLDKNDKGNTKAALPMRIKAINVELTATDFPGLIYRQETENN